MSRKITYGAYVRFRGRDDEAVFTVAGFSTDSKEVLCQNCWGGQFWHPVAGLKSAYDENGNALRRQV